MNHRGQLGDRSPDDRSAGRYGEDNGYVAPILRFREDALSRLHDVAPRHLLSVSRKNPNDKSPGSSEFSPTQNVSELRIGELHSTLLTPSKAG